MNTCIVEHTCNLCDAHQKTTVERIVQDDVHRYGMLLLYVRGEYTVNSTYIYVHVLYMYVWMNVLEDPMATVMYIEIHVQE